MFQITNLLYYKSYSNLKIYNEERWQYLPNGDGYKFILIYLLNICFSLNQINKGQSQQKQKKNYYI